MPSRRASERPMAIACFRLVTFLPLRPDFSFPFFISRISRSTFLPADGEYLRPEDFFELDFLELDGLDDDARVLFRELLDFFRVAFLVAMTILLEGQMRSGLRQVACGRMQRIGIRRTKMKVALHDAAYTGNAHERIGDEPRRNTCERARYDELEKCGRDPWMEQQADAYEYGRMNDVDSIGTAVKP